VLRRDIDHLQVGTSPGTVISDRPGLYPFLLSLDGSRDLGALQRDLARDHPELEVDLQKLLKPLIAAGAIVDMHDTARPRLRIAVAPDGPATPFAHTVGELLAAVDLDVAPEPDLTLMISTGEPPRAPLTNAVHTRLPHLVIVLDGESVRIGPFVLPGQLPCQNCFDLQRASWDPTWSALVPQFGRPQRSAISPLTHHAAAAEVAAECLRFAEGVAPRATSEVFAITPDRTTTSVATARFHPRCACALLSVA
jgi:hypothetical protein